MSKGKLVKRETTPTKRIEQEGDLLEVGQWYWVSARKRKWVVDGKVAFEQGSDEYEEDEEDEDEGKPKEYFVLTEADALFIREIPVEPRPSKNARNIKLLLEQKEAILKEKGLS